MDSVFRNYTRIKLYSEKLQNRTDWLHVKEEIQWLQKKFWKMKSNPRPKFLRATDAYACSILNDNATLWIGNRKLAEAEVLKKFCGKSRIGESELCLVADVLNSNPLAQTWIFVKGFHTKSSSFDLLNSVPIPRYFCFLFRHFADTWSVVLIDAKVVSAYHFASEPVTLSPTQWEFCNEVFSATGSNCSTASIRMIRAAHLEETNRTTGCKGTKRCVCPKCDSSEGSVLFPHDCSFLCDFLASATKSQQMEIQLALILCLISDSCKNSDHIQSIIRGTACKESCFKRLKWIQNPKKFRRFGDHLRHCLIHGIIKNSLRFEWFSEGHSDERKATTASKAVQTTKPAKRPIPTAPLPRKLSLENRFDVLRCDTDVEDSGLEDEDSEFRSCSDITQ